MSTHEFPSASEPSPQDEAVAELLTRSLAAEAESVTAAPGGLEKIRARTDASRRSRTPWVVGAIGAGVAAAAVIVAAVAMTGGGGGHGAVAPATTEPSETNGVAPVTAHQGVYDPTAPADEQYTIYYVGKAAAQGGPATPDHIPRLYEETHTVTAGGSPPQLTALNEVLSADPIDPSYEPSAASGVTATAISRSNGVTTVDLVGPADQGTVAGLGIVDHSYPAGFEQYEALSLQAILRTVGGQGPVTFTYNGQPIDQFMLQKLPVSPAPDEQVRAWVTIDNIVNGQTVSNPVTVEISGNVFEGTVSWTLDDGAGHRVKDGYVTTSQGMWTQVPVELGTLEAGTYTFSAFEVSAKDGKVINKDDKAFTVE